MNLTDIQNDHVSGADELLNKSAQYLTETIDQFNIECPLDTFINAIQKAGLDLIQAQPRMAPLLNLVNRVLIKTSLKSDIPHLKSIIVQEIGHVVEQSVQAKQVIAERFTQLVKPHNTLLTYSRSSVVMNAIEHAAMDKSIKVLVTESRPVYEGRTAAEQLTQLSIPVSLYTDAAMGEAVQEADCVVIGADAFDHSYFINKTGTLALCLLCRHFDKPVYALASSLKRVPDLNLLPEESKKPEKEVWREKPKPVNVINRYFETIPLDLLTGLITEEGIVNAGTESFSDYDPWLIDKLNSLDRDSG